MSEREWRQHPEFPHEWEGPRTEETVVFNGTELIVGREDDGGQGWCGVYVPLRVLQAVLRAQGMHIVPATIGRVVVVQSGDQIAPDTAEPAEKQPDSR